MATVIVGAGIVGVSTAYYLSQHQPPPADDADAGAIHLVEAADRLFASASGYAGGFLARDWFAPAAAALGALSFDQHRALAERHDGRRHWGYAASTALSYGLPAGDEHAARTEPPPRGEDWLRQGTSRSTAAPAGDDDGTATAAPPWLGRRAGDRVEVLAPSADVGGLGLDGHGCW